MPRPSQPDDPKHMGYMGPPKWEPPFKSKKSYPIAQIIAAARRFEADGELENGMNLRKLAAKRVKTTSKWYRTLQRRKTS